jgi:hypothetical protein
VELIVWLEVRVVEARRAFAGGGDLGVIMDYTTRAHGIQKTLSIILLPTLPSAPSLGGLLAFLPGPPDPALGGGTFASQSPALPAAPASAPGQIRCVQLSRGATGSPGANPTTYGDIQLRGKGKLRASLENTPPDVPFDTRRATRPTAILSLSPVWSVRATERSQKAAPTRAKPHCPREEMGLPG